MLGLEESHLWNTAFRTRKESRALARAREGLKVSLRSFRDRARDLVAQIPRDLAELTVHDISHLDALWHYADLITGSQVELNPVEGFVLGGAFLIHDAGMSLAAYPNGYEDLRRHSAWEDSLVVVLQEHLGRAPTKEEVFKPDAAALRMTVALLLRELHAETAEKLVETAWAGPDKEEYHLITDPDLRKTLGPVIGRIAHSHWWPLSKVASEFTNLLGPPLALAPWNVDPLRLACILRLADAAHVDWRRAPRFLRALVKPAGVSADHWGFQEHLNTPILDNERLVYTSNKPFSISEARSWWLCYDSLRLVDLELRSVDALCADRNLPRFAARAVKGTEDPLRLTQFIPTKGWVPVDARVMVSDVAALVSRLGGEELYGDDPTVPLRELIQNACDAVRARRTIERRPEGWGEVVVSMGRDEFGQWIEVSDNGIGMSETVLTGPFLDFGKSFWGSSLMLSELPGLAASQFRPTGRYGIGFFSAFMWGDMIRVTTLRSGEASRDTRILEFVDGTRSRPILRKATTTEQLAEGGTAIRVWLRKDPNKSGGLLQDTSLPHVVRVLCPALDVQISIQNRSKKLLISKSQQWLSATGPAFFKRIQEEAPDPPRARGLTRNLRPLHLDDGSIAGRACVVPHHIWHDGVVCVGGLKARELVGIAGILFGRSTRAARDKTEIMVLPVELARWATEQSTIALATFSDPDELVACAATIHLCGGDATELPLVRLGEKWLSASGLAARKDIPQPVILTDQQNIATAYERYGDADLNENVLLTAPSYPRSIFEDADYSHFGPVEELVMRSLSKAWGRKVSASLSEGEEVGDDVYCEGTVFYPRKDN